MKTSKEIEIVIPEIDFYLIEKIRELRLKNNPKVSQVALSQMIGVADGFVGKVENFKEPSKYNFWHINKIVKSLNLNFSDILTETIKNDIVRIRLKFKDGVRKEEISYDIMFIKPLTENEMELYKRRKIPYLKKII